MKKRALAIFLCILLLPSLALADLAVYFLNIGQGDSAIIVCGGKAMIIDGGLPNASSYIHSFITDHPQINEFTYVVATHPDRDHIGGLPAVLEEKMPPVQYVFSPVDDYDSDRFQILKEYAQKRKLKIKIPYDQDVYRLGNHGDEATVTFYNCGRKRKSIVRSIGDRVMSIFRQNEPEENHENNDMSLVVRIVYGDTSFLFTGDIEKEAEERLISSQYALKSNVLKVAHHGSRSSSTPEFLRYVDPQYAVISVGNNSYGHPSSQTLSALQSMDVKLYRTDLQGMITCISDGKTVTFKTEKNANADVYRGQ